MRRGILLTRVLAILPIFKAEQIPLKAKHQSESNQDGPLLWNVTSFPGCSHRSVPVLSHVCDFASCYCGRMVCPPHGATQRGKRTESLQENALKPSERRPCQRGGLGYFLTYFCLCGNWHQKIYQVGMR